MKDKDKIKFAEAVLNLVPEVVEEKRMKPAGLLNKPQGLKGFKRCDIGDIVFEYDNRYFLVMETLDGKMSAEVPYVKETLSPAIDKF